MGTYVHQRIHTRDFPGGPVVKNLPASAGDMGSIPAREIPHAAGQQFAAQLLKLG